jgi:hypothetical protein
LSQITSRDGSVGIATSYGLNSRRIGVRSAVGATDISVLHGIQTDSRTHPACYPIDIGISFTGGKTARA